MVYIAEKYFRIESIGVKLHIFGIDVQRNIRFGVYEVYIGDEWIKLDGAEMRGSTAVGVPTRSLEFDGSGSLAEKLLRLEAQLRNGCDLVQMKDLSGEKFEVHFKKSGKSYHTESVISLLCATGDFLLRAVKRSLNAVWLSLEGERFLGRRERLFGVETGLYL